MSASTVFMPHAKHPACLAGSSAFHTSTVAVSWERSARFTSRGDGWGMRLRRSLPLLVSALLLLPTPALAADGLGPGGYAMLAWMFLMAVVVGLLVVVGGVALVVWL